MRIGISIWPEILNAPEFLKLKDLEFKDIEVHTNDDEKFKAFLLDYAKKLGLRFSVHCPHAYYDANVNFCSDKPEVMENSDFWLKKSIKYAKELDARHIIIHPDILKDISRQDALIILESHLKNNLKLLDKSQRILIENMPDDRYGLSTPEEFKDFLKRFDDRVAVCWDVGHEIHRFRNQNFEFPKLLGQRIKEVHISGVVNFNDHYPLTKGNLDLAGCMESLKKINYKGAIIFEILTKNPADIIESKKEIERFIKN